MKLSPDKQWYLFLTVDGTVEDTVILQNVSESSLEFAVEDLMSRIQIEINPFQLQKLIGDLKKEASHIFIKDKHDRELAQPIIVGGASSSLIEQSVRPAGQSFQRQQSLIHEYRSKLSNIKKPTSTHWRKYSREF